ncbi:MAG: D-glycero-beta-D-manno-heptose 1,7-bisphosphate 7-phosphatase [gamma proteobacterium symbiont of Bathyaustriella thionipta]|nr:D-glycero-beta-D-manno-heptose 1,7-bisphosphate 7-phosphatase [gamma proteobacterium symbiont of Bathyaustriella thionipta]MCU7950129.1 D-glycero-beta-D-manno-heptose 1,7-bisphosphate 7-phosphatase [gamma proteobacterium symbiont of Bathyaustriella thionipta]MCU7954861.1 D-glycero-beta-D-manno-heptose 1,7-bisphosphate 7-phosphatase [gamma proteobacterium symbiont of Bathyaustriella thionipta]MCU7956690.1 D-glycero-beta-D-manno-heptose 1,7-bisphosphate 7-phosphatase [gamma proteobacterium symb
MQKLIILDRDGVINQDSDNYIKTVDEFIPIAGSLEAIARLCQAGFSVMVATNQSGISRQYFTLDTLSAMHEKLQALLAPLGGKIEHFYYCPHGPDDHCACRKPEPGMINQIAEDFFISTDVGNQSAMLANVFVVGDSLRDLEAGNAAGAKVALVKTGKGMRSLHKIAQDSLSEYSQLPVYKDLADFTDHFLKQSNPA